MSFAWIGALAASSWRAIHSIFVGGWPGKRGASLKISWLRSTISYMNCSGSRRSGDPADRHRRAGQLRDLQLGKDLGHEHLELADHLVLGDLGVVPDQG